MVTEPQRASRSAPNALVVKGPLSPYETLFRDVQQEWNKAERAIKRAEQIALDVSIPAISELRYAGRRIVDALALDGANSDNEAKILALLEDARFCCHRAQHDAIDASMAKIAIDLDDLTSRLGYAAVATAYPPFNEFYAEFTVARGRIADSRENREDRNTIYDAITVVDLPALIAHYEKVMAVRTVAKSHARSMRLGQVNGFALIVIAVITMIFAGMAVDWGKWLPSHAKAAQPIAATVEHKAASVTPSSPLRAALSNRASQAAPGAP